MCGGDNKHHVAVEETHNTLSKQTQNTKGACCATCVLAELRAHYTTHAIPQEREKKEKRRRKKRRKGKKAESSVRRWRRSSR
nr:MAG TPA: hypothetical protein [Caudoviricetes sp.]